MNKPPDLPPISFIWVAFTSRINFVQDFPTSAPRSAIFSSHPPSLYPCLDCESLHITTYPLLSMNAPRAWCWRLCGYSLNTGYRNRVLMAYLTNYSQIWDLPLALNLSLHLCLSNPIYSIFLLEIDLSGRKSSQKAVFKPDLGGFL